MNIYTVQMLDEIYWLTKNKTGTVYGKSLETFQTINNVDLSNLMKAAGTYEYRAVTAGRDFRATFDTIAGGAV